MDAFLDEINKKSQAQESLPTHPEEKMPQKIKCPTSDLVIHDQKRVTGDSSLPFINYNNVTEVSETARPEKVTYSIDKALQHLTQLCDKAIDAEDRANRANREEILCWYLY
ncbi:hypothetical protein GLOIN_2v1761214 [Rhizophagus irregularis DAOM 181602=DAOM 197198]|uniref:Uncharacterized protein n=1 Tax=Rhizophagus irregularis (strain DAOM 181602 / DAOM 197198 / MUCL 43194) TaxID=747089 RepID=U9T2P5_RHIID|nr:hypothetical protein GLOIN_2v1761214 [Rhizophagus irregularis DAOM 181602=DAOM 197198]